MKKKVKLMIKSNKRESKWKTNEIEINVMNDDTNCDTNGNLTALD